MNTQTTILLTPDELEGMIERIVKRAVRDLREDRRLSRAEVCKLIGRSSDTVIRMVERGELIEHRKGKERPWYLLSEVLDWKDKTPSKK